MHAGKTEEKIQNNENEMKSPTASPLDRRKGAGLRPRAEARPCPGQPGCGAGGVFRQTQRKGHPDERSTTARTENRGSKISRTPRDHYQEVTDRIIAALEAGTPPWRRPWDPGQGRRPGDAAQRGDRAALSRHQRADARHVALAFSSGDPRWATYKQAEDRGWQVRKGERGTTGYFFKRLERARRFADRRVTKTR